MSKKHILTANYFNFNDEIFSGISFLGSICHTSAKNIFQISQCFVPSLIVDDLLISPDIIVGLIYHWPPLLILSFPSICLSSKNCPPVVQSDIS